MNGFYFMGLEAGASSFKLFYGLRKGHFVKELHEPDHIAPCAAPKALPEVGCGINRKGRLLVFMEGAKAGIAPAVLLQGDPPRLDQRYQVHPLLDRFNGLFLDHPSPSLPPQNLPFKPCQEKSVVKIEKLS